MEEFRSRESSPSKLSNSAISVTSSCSSLAAETLDDRDVVPQDRKYLDNAVPNSTICRVASIPSAYRQWVRLLDIHKGTYSNYYLKFHFIRPSDKEVFDDVMANVGHIRGTIVCISPSWADDDDESEVTLGKICKTDIAKVVGYNCLSPEEMVQDKCSDLYPTEFQEVVEGVKVLVTYYDNGWHVGTHRYMDAGQSKWGCQRSFGEIFNELIASDKNFYNKLPRGEGYTHTFIIRHPSMETMTPIKTPQLVYSGTICEKGVVKFLDFSQEYNVNRTQPFDVEDWPSSDVGIILYKDGKQVAIVYSKEYQRKRELWGDSPSVQNRICEIYLTPQRQEFVRAFPRYSGLVATATRNYKNLITKLVDAAKARRQKKVFHLDGALHHICKNTEVVGNETDDELRALFSETFRTMFYTGELKSYTFYKLMTTGVTVPAVKTFQKK